MAPFSKIPALAFPTSAVIPATLRPFVDGAPSEYKRTLDTGEARERRNQDRDALVLTPRSQVRIDMLAERNAVWPIQGRACAGATPKPIAHSDAKGLHALVGPRAR